VLGGEYGSALQAACGAGDLEAAKLLLRHGANVNVSGGYYHTALVAAAAASHRSLELVQLLLDSGAEVNTNGGKYGSAFRVLRYYCSTLAPRSMPRVGNTELRSKQLVHRGGETA